MVKLIVIIAMLIITAGTGVVFTPHVVDVIAGKVFEQYDIMPR